MNRIIVKVKKSNSKISKSTFKKYADIINSIVGKNLYLTIRSQADS